MTRTGRLAAIAALATLSACAGPGSELAGPFPAATRPAAAVAPSRPVFATQLAGPATFLAPMPTAVVLLKPGDLNRNRAFCTAFTSRLPTAAAATAASAVAPNLVLTRWLVQLPDLPPDRATDCDLLVGTYDYSRAARLLANARLTDGAFTGPGPFLVMIVPDANGLHLAGLDGSAYAQADFGSFIDSWGGAVRQTQDRLARDPETPGVVRSLFNLVTAILRTAARATAGLITGLATSL